MVPESLFLKKKKEAIDHILLSHLRGYLAPYSEEVEEDEEDGGRRGTRG